MPKTNTLRTKISFAIVAIVIFILICVGAIGAISIRDISKTLTTSNTEMGTTSSATSSSSVSALTQRRLLELAGNKAAIVDRMFLDFEQAVRMAATAAEKIYQDPESYEARPVSRPAAENDGKLSLQILYASDVDPEDEAIAEEAALLGNIQDTLFAINDNFDSMASNYFAAESGFMIQADYISASKFDSSGELMPLNAKERPWYVGAAETGKPFFTPVTKDAHTTRLAVMCGVPVYSGGVLKGVSGAGIYLDAVDALVQSIDLGERGDACILNQEGQVLFSTIEKGELAAYQDEEDLNSAIDAGPRELTARASDGESGVKLLYIDEEMRYVAYAPMETVGWTFFIILSREEVEAPTQRLRAALSQITEQATQDARERINRAIVLMIVVLTVAVAAALLISLLLSRRIVEPIQMLTDKVRNIEGDNLDFRWDMDTGDETQLLASSFESLTQRMKDYITNIQHITAERERIDTELALATRIQASMLPNVFPPFPDKREFDLFATMEPAREVGGDFYDFYLVDDDHLCLVIADVSGKGIPAALFMMVSKILLQSSAMLGNSPAATLEKTNETLCSNNKMEMFVTAWIGILEISTGKLTAANAGHEYPAIRRADGRFELLKDAHGFIIGGMEGSKYRDYTLQLEPGAKLFLYTDGVPEATDGSGKMLGTERMLEALNIRPHATPRQILASVRGVVDTFVGDAEQFDDLTMLCIEYKGPRE